MCAKINRTPVKGWPILLVALLALPATAIYLAYHGLLVIAGVVTLWGRLLLDAFLLTLGIAAHALQVLVIILWTAFRIVKKLSQPK